MSAEEVWDRACNDYGPGGVCTWCDALHTVTVIVPCDGCYFPPDECRCNVVAFARNRASDIAEKDKQ